jgi:hypothetical protein
LNIVANFYLLDLVGEFRKNTLKSITVTSYTVLNISPYLIITLYLKTLHKSPVDTASLTYLLRYRRRWENIKIDLREIGWEVVDWTHVAEDREQ